MKILRTIAAGVGAVLVFATSACSLSSQSPTSVWDGTYTNEQAAAGAAGYKKSCGSCHGTDLMGSGQAPPLAGAEFAMNWNGMMVSDLFEKIQTSMPGDRPGTLTRPENAEILAYMFQANKFPAGKTELSAVAGTLNKIRFETKPSK